MKDTTDNTLRKRKKNTQIRIVTLLTGVLFLALTVYIVRYSVNNRQELISNSYNTRQKILVKRNLRGTIYDRDRVELAKSTVYGDGTEVRNYPYGSMYAHAVGYAVNGNMGVEGMANYYLINSNAPISVKARCDSKGEKYPADSVNTTLSHKLQEVAYNAMGVYKGAVIVTDPKTGEVLALVSKPDFDPATVRENWDSYINDNESGVLVNRATQGLYPPGSTFKIFTVFEYLKENPKTYEEYTYNCTGSIQRGDDIVRCYHGTVHGSLDLERSFAKSCNSSFANMGLTLDRREFGKTLDRFLFNKELPTELTSTVCHLEVDNDTDDSDMMQISIGQGKANISPLLLNMVTCSIANDGVLMKPHILRSVENCEGTVIKSYKDESYGELMTKEEAERMRYLMEDVVNEGTATALKGQSYIAGGKTGSAEFGKIKGESHAWFTGFAYMPSEGSEEVLPDICVTIIIEEAGAGGEYAVPVAKRIFDAYYADSTGD